MQTILHDVKVLISDAHRTYGSTRRLDSYSSCVPGPARILLQSYNQETLRLHGIETVFVQDNHSKSSQGTLRGLHFQLSPMAQVKLVRCARGAIWDVAVDIRVGSPTFGQWVGVELSAENFRQIYVPEGFAHGFCVLSDEAEVLYKTSAVYSRAHERGIAWNDPRLAVAWPEAEPLLSDRDRLAPSLADYLAGTPFVYAARENVCTFARVNVLTCQPANVIRKVVSVDTTYDYVVIGSGFGGSVSAMRLAEKGYSVLVLERGKRFRDEDFAKTNWRVWKYLWLPPLRCFGILQITAFRNVMVLHGCGVGGGSLGYANVLMEPDDKLFDAPNWRDLADWKTILKPHYETAKRMLGVDPQPQALVRRSRAAGRG